MGDRSFQIPFFLQPIGHDFLNKLRCWPPIILGRFYYTFSQHDELSEIRRLTLAVTMAVFGSVSLGSFERSALIAIASLVSNRMSALVDEINEHDDADASPVPAGPS